MKKYNRPSGYYVKETSVDNLFLEKNNQPLNIFYFVHFLLLKYIFDALSWRIATLALYKLFSRKAHCRKLNVNTESQKRVAVTIQSAVAGTGSLAPTRNCLLLPLSQSRGVDWKIISQATNPPNNAPCQFQMCDWNWQLKQALYNQ